MDNLPFVINHTLPLADNVARILEASYNLAQERHNEFITPEHLLLSLYDDSTFRVAFNSFNGQATKFLTNLNSYISGLDVIPDNNFISAEPSIQLIKLINEAEQFALNAENDKIKITHIVKSLLELPDSNAAYFLEEALSRDSNNFLRILITQSESNENIDIDPDSMHDFLHEGGEETDWKNLVVCVNDITDSRNPLIGREEELQKTIRVLCRKDKNNPLHIGEPGVGKTALVYGLARLIEKGDIPDSLKNSKIYQIDLGNLIAGTQFRGDFEKRIKSIMDGVSKQENPIVYIDEIHNLVGAGSTADNSLDASNMLKPYLESGKIRFIGSTTYDEYKRHFAKSKGIVRRFSQIDIPEPGADESVEILRQLKGIYENFHNVSYTDEALEFAVKGSIRYIPERFLPDKAIDLIDEAGAMKQIQISKGETVDNTIDRQLIAEVLARASKVDSVAIAEEDNRNIQNIEKNISANIFGQSDAVREVSEAVMMAKAGLTDENKPLASLLFVGPTGVGKTEVAKVLARELGIELLRFDMSEYTEKHTVAKLIGSPAGYVGYEDGGLLTDAIRKSPNAVLLLDEIEKAHQDIYNILLQVMDYGKLTDNKGNKADFRNVVLIMTSNAGAQFAAQANVGFASSTTRGSAMLQQVKKTFKPEFINRLSATVVFNDMNREMADLILDKKLKELSQALENKKVKIDLTPEAKDFLLNKGFTPEYGAREFDRVIHQYVKRPLMKEILFGSLKEGGMAHFVLEDDKKSVKIKN